MTSSLGAVVAGLVAVGDAVPHVPAADTSTQLRSSAGISAAYSAMVPALIQRFAELPPEMATVSEPPLMTGAVQMACRTEKGLALRLGLCTTGRQVPKTAEPDEVTMSWPPVPVPVLSATTPETTTRLPGVTLLGNAAVHARPVPSVATDPLLWTGPIYTASDQALFGL